jgi:hypothetical protein
MDQSSRHGLHSTVRYHVEFSLVSVHSSYIVICSVDKSDMFGQIVVRLEKGLPMEMLFDCLNGSCFARMS